MAAQRGLRGLEGSLWVEKVSLRGGERSFAASIAERIPVDPAAIRRAVSRPVARIDALLRGEAREEEGALWLIARGSGTRLRLVNRTAQDENDEPEDVLGRILETLRAGDAQVEVAGELLERDGAPVLLLSHARRSG